MAPKKSRKVVQETMVEEPTQDPDVPPQAMGEEEQKDSEGEQDHDSHEDHESEEEQPNAMLFTPQQLEVLLKMNRPDYNELVAALKAGSSKSVGFKPARPGNFEGARDRKVVDAWLAEMEDYLHAAKVGRHSAMELTQSYLKGYASTWWRTMRQEKGKTHGYTWEFFKERIELEFIPKNSDYKVQIP
jgi:signal recognition particle GTPase